MLKVIRELFISQAILILLLCAASSAADVVVIADIKLNPVVDIISGIRETLDSRINVYSPVDAKGRLRSIAAKEDARVVIALGKDAVDEALQLPSSIAVIYDLVLTPPSVKRPNTTGFYMATPVREYVDLIKNYLPPIRRIAVVGSRDLMNILNGTASPQVASYNVKSPFEFVSTVKQLDSADAILLLPDISLLTASAVEETYLLSFRRKIPLLGVSERNVKQGAFLALVFDPRSVGRQIGERAADAIEGKDVGQIPPSPPRNYELFINTDTASKMGIYIPSELSRRATRVYP